LRILYTMKNYLLIVLMLLAAVANGQNYPATKKTPKAITNHGITYTDDYAWLEDMRSPEALAWTKAQNKVTDAHINSMPGAMATDATIKKYQAQTRYRMPAIKGKYFYSKMFRDEGMCLFYREELDGRPIELINPHYIYPDKSVYIDSYHPSQSSEVLAYQLSIDGGDRKELRFVTIKNGKKHKDIIQNIKFSNISWKGDEGVFYKKNNNVDQFAVDSTYRVFYHRLNTLEADDKLIFDGTSTRSYLNFFTSEDGEKFFLIEVSKDGHYKNYYYANLSDPELKLVKFFSATTNDFSIVGFHKGRVYILTELANWGDLRYFELDKPDDIKVLIPQTQNQLLQDVSFFEDRILCKYTNTKNDFMMLYDHDAAFIAKIKAPEGTFLTTYVNNYTAKELFFTVENYTIPPILFKMDLATGAYDRFTSETYKKPTAPFSVDHFETKETSFINRDNVEVAITLVYKKGTALNGNNPTLLEAYGGYNYVYSKDYDNGLVYFLEKGGVYAFAHIRGGGEKGNSWHKKGKGINKINCLNDFIDAAEFLIREKYTSPQRLGITGGSHGGLVVGHAAVMRPDLFKVVISKMGVYDMGIKHNFTTGYMNSQEYGDPENKAEYEAMLAYSPYNNIKDDVDYPTMLIITSDNDDRVPPLHSYKFAAKLQNRPAQKNPVYLRTLAHSGHHGISSSHDEMLEDMADFYTFLLYHLNK
jgi:prolyl oligopeptidase